MLTDWFQDATGGVEGSKGPKETVSSPDKPTGPNVEVKSDTSGNDQPKSSKKERKKANGKKGSRLSSRADRRGAGSLKSGKATTSGPAKITTFKVDRARKIEFEQKIRRIDGAARFVYKGRTWKVVHSLCGGLFNMKGAYKTGPFQSHAERCQKSLKVGVWVEREVSIQRLGIVVGKEIEVKASEEGGLRTDESVLESDSGSEWKED